LVAVFVLFSVEHPSISCLIFTEATAAVVSIFVDESQGRTEAATKQAVLPNLSY